MSFCQNPSNATFTIVNKVLHGLPLLTLQFHLTVLLLLPNILEPAGPDVYYTSLFPTLGLH